MHLSQPDLALICVLMLRGAQTLGELRGSAMRLYEFSGLEEAEETLNALMSRDQDPLVTRLPRQPGQKEARFAHLLSGEVTVEHSPESESSPRAPRTIRDPDKVAKLEQEVADLKSEVATLQKQFEEFKKQFE
jgi:uncharacterized protein YceH (UPF0502 family)